MPATLDPDKFQQIVLFEDWTAQGRPFLPLGYTHALAELRVGAFTQLERLQRSAWQIPITLDVREARKELARERSGLNVNSLLPNQRTLFLNARVFLDETLIAEINTLELDDALNANESGSYQRKRDSKVAIFSDKGTRSESDLLLDFNKERFLIEVKRSRTIDAKLFRGLWEMIHFNSTAIKSDRALASSSLRNFSEHSHDFNYVAALQPENVWLGESVDIAPGVVLDATKGPIILNDGVKIMANAVIVGPCVIGANSLIKIGAKLYEGTTIGPVCKVGGEVENSIILGYSNKQHDGYLGHSYLGEWVNLGADTNTSDLKNDYSNVTLTIEDQAFETGSQFVGLLMGDHSKTAINSQFNTGSVVGVSCNLFGEGFPPKWIPNFTWGGAGKFEAYRIEKALAVARTVMQRRDKTLSAADEALLTSLSREK